MSSPPPSPEKPAMLRSQKSRTNFANSEAVLISEHAQPDIRRVLSNPSMLRQLEDLAATEEDVDTSGVPTDAQTRLQPMLWALLAAYQRTGVNLEKHTSALIRFQPDTLSLQKNFVHHLEYSLCVGERPKAFTDYLALAHTVRDYMVERWKDTQMHFFSQDPKRVYYLSMEYLMGRTLQNAMINLGLQENLCKALFLLGVNLEDCIPQEKDAGLGNGGLGRLAACFMDSLATQDYPAWGYGLRYQYGMFFQRIRNGEQIEEPDYWLNFGNPYEIERLDITYLVQFGGYLTASNFGDRARNWQAADRVLAVAYDTPIPGYDTWNTLNVRLWSSKPSNQFDLESFNRGDYYNAIEQRQRAENITHVLYPNDNTQSGKELRLRQQYFFTSATLQDILRRFKRRRRSWDEFAQKNAVQLNDTHPTLAIPELMRLLLDVEGLDWDAAWKVTEATFSYTNHTVLPEALERWPVDMAMGLLPRHMQVIFDINAAFMSVIEAKWPGDIDRMRRMSIIDENQPRTIRMAHLAIVGSHAVNGVAAIHSDIVRNIVFKDFAELWPEKFFNVTNGVTPRRWLAQANPGLKGLLTEMLGTDTWLLDLDLLSGVRKFVNDASWRKRWMSVKLENKVRLAAVAKSLCGVDVDPNTMLFDVHVKRFHEYKRQLLNILSVIYRYRQIKAMAPAERAQVVPRAVFFGGKAAPGYYMAKSLHKLLKVVFVPNYCVSLCEVIVPASDLSQHISTAGTEASGTSNMKFSMNGGLIIGTLDGANIEIRDAIGKENMFIFGALAQDVNDLRERVRAKKVDIDPRFNEVLGMIAIGKFGDVSTFQPIIDAMRPGNDHYLVSVDFPTYLDAQARVDATYKDQDKWTTMSMHCTAGMGQFSSDRSIRDYAEKIWKVTPCRRDGPMPVDISAVDKSLAAIASSVADDKSSIRVSKERYGASGVFDSRAGQNVAASQVASASATRIPLQPTSIPSLADNSVQAPLTTSYPAPLK